MMARSKADPRINVLLQTYDQAYDKTAWHGTNLRGALRGVKLTELLWRPGKERHNVWEIALHCAYWKYVVWRRITGGKKGTFQRKPSNWPKLSLEPSVKVWQESLALLEYWHQSLRKEIAEFPPVKLNSKPTNSRVSFIQAIYGISSHDLYHAGQIQLLKRLVRK